MQYRTDPKSGNQLSALGFGCMRFPKAGNQIDMEKTEALLLEAYENGVNYYDTAYIYPGSEEAVGTVFAKHGIREKVYIATKLPHMMCATRADFDRLFETSLQRLKTEYVDYYFIHNISDFAQWEKLVALGVEDWIAEKKAGGQIRQIGFSFHGPQAHFGRLLDAYDWDFCQIQYNYINVNYQAGQKGLRDAAARGMPVMVMEPLLGGRLANALPKEAAGIFAKADPAGTPAGWALRWLWNQPEVTLLLSGMNAPEQLAENLRLADATKPGSMDEAQLAVVDAAVTAFNKSYRVPCTGCNYCMPCPKGIDIPACFAAYNTSYAIGWVPAVTQYVTACGAMSDEPHFASDCVKCGKCMGHCPQGIQIPEALGKASRRLQPPGLRKLIPIARKMMM